MRVGVRDLAVKRNAPAISAYEERYDATALTGCRGIVKVNAVPIVE
jgi:hypothetical protein